MELLRATPRKKFVSEKREILNPVGRGKAVNRKRHGTCKKQLVLEYRTRTKIEMIGRGRAARRCCGRDFSDGALESLKIKTAAKPLGD
jgi:hypothetical protein